MSITLRSTASSSDVRLELITPAMAAEWLQFNVHNRKINEPRVNQLVQDILAGRWMLNGETIKFDREGRLLDGQHRLMAVVQAKTAIQSLVMYALDPMAQLTIDIGQQRTTGQQLALAGITNTNATAALAVCLIRIDLYPHLIWNTTLIPSKSEQIQYVIRHKDALEAAVVSGHKAWSATRINKTAYAALHFVAHREGYDIEWQTFDDGFVSGISLNAGDPRLALRNFAVRPGVIKTAWHQQMGVAVTFKAFNAYRTGKTMKLLRFTRDQLPLPGI